MTNFQSAQVGPIESKREDGKGHRQQSGINDAARQLGLERKEVQRAVKIASLSPEAQAVAVETKMAKLAQPGPVSRSVEMTKVVSAQVGLKLKGGQVNRRKLRRLKASAWQATDWRPMQWQSESLLQESLRSDKPLKSSNY